jgi:lipoprotein-releasing system ATP-binding protein
MTMISALNIVKSFGSLKVLKGISLEVKKNEFISIVGASGAGKTTLLHILGTLERPDSGTVFYDNKDVFSLNDRQKSSLRNKDIGFVFQFHHLLPEFTALENIMLPSFISGTSRKKAEQRALELLDYMGIAERKDHKPAQMSGGEQQRVAVARALINSPKVLLADEPSGNLDSKNAADLHALFLKLRKEMDQTIIIITHNHDLATIADRQLEMKDGFFVN